MLSPDVIGSLVISSSLLAVLVRPIRISFPLLTILIGPVICPFLLPASVILIGSTKIGEAYNRNAGENKLFHDCSNACRHLVKQELEHVSVELLQISRLAAFNRLEPPPRGSQFPN